MAIKRVEGTVPDLIFHKGDVGKEPMINIFGKSAVDVVMKLIKIAEQLRAGRHT